MTDLETKARKEHAKSGLPNATKEMFISGFIAGYTARANEEIEITGSIALVQPRPVPPTDNGGA